MSRKVNDCFSAGQIYYNWQPNVSTFNMHLMPCYKVGSIIEPKFIEFLILLERVVSAQDKKVQNNL